VTKYALSIIEFRESSVYDRKHALMKIWIFCGLLCANLFLVACSPSTSTTNPKWKLLVDEEHLKLGIKKGATKNFECNLFLGKPPSLIHANVGLDGKLESVSLDVDADTAISFDFSEAIGITMVLFLVETDGPHEKYWDIGLDCCWDIKTIGGPKVQCVSLVATFGVNTAKDMLLQIDRKAATLWVG